MKWLALLLALGFIGFALGCTDGEDDDDDDGQAQDDDIDEDDDSDYYEEVADGWTVETVDGSYDMVFYPSTAISGNDEILVAYYVYEEGYKGKDDDIPVDYYGVRFAHWDTEQRKWRIDEIAFWESEVTMDTAIALNSAGKPYIAYFGYEPDYWKYGSLGLHIVTINPDSGWEFELIELTGYDDGYDLAMRIGADDRIHVAYFKRGEGLKYAFGEFGSLQKEFIDQGENLGQHPSMAIGEDDSVHVSYLDMSTRDLKYANNVSGSWAVYTIDSESEVGWFTSIGLDSQGAAHISYYDDTGGALKYATDASGDWQTYIIDSEGDVGGYTSLAIDSNGNIHISYYDYTDRALKYATNAQGNWTAITVHRASFGSMGKYTALALDSAENVHIFYQNSARGSLLHATNSPNWKKGG